MRVAAEEMLNLFLKYSANTGANGKVNIAIVGGGATGVKNSPLNCTTRSKQLHGYGYKGLTNEAPERNAGEAENVFACITATHAPAAAHNELTKLGVRVLTQTMVTVSDKGGLHTKRWRTY